MLLFSAQYGEFQQDASCSAVVINPSDNIHRRIKYVKKISMPGTQKE